MKAIRFVFCLFAALMLTTFNGLAAEEEDFKTFLRKFTSSASFQYSPNQVSFEVSHRPLEG